MKLYDCLKDDPIFYDFFELAKNCLKGNNLDNYNEEGHDSSTLSNGDKQDVREILSYEFLAN
jgi:hypothetical protein